MPKRIEITIRTDGLTDIRYPDAGNGIEGQVERDLAWLWTKIGGVEIRGHKPHQHSHEGVHDHDSENTSA